MRSWLNSCPASHIQLRRSSSTTDLLVRHLSLRSRIALTCYCRRLEGAGHRSTHTKTGTTRAPRFQHTGRRRSRGATEAATRGAGEIAPRLLYTPRLTANRKKRCQTLHRKELPDENPRPHKRARPGAGATVFTMDDDENFIESTVEADAASDEVVVDLN